MSTLDDVLSFLQGKGLTRAQAAGVAGNLQVESGLNPAAYNAREGAIGLAQWENGRRANLQAYARATGGTETNLATQLGYLWQELQGPESGALAKLTATNDAGTAAAVFDQYYERSSGSSRATRVSNAQAIAGGTSTAGGGSTSSAGGSVADSLGGGLFNWQSGVFSIAVKVVAAAAAAGLVIAGAVNTVN